MKQKIPDCADGDLKSDEWMRACVFKAERVLTMPVKTIGPHHQRPLCPILGAPTPTSIAIKLTSHLSYHH